MSVTTDRVLVCGSMAFDTIAVFEGRFKEHIVPERVHALSVSFLVPEMRRESTRCRSPPSATTRKNTCSICKSWVSPRLAWPSSMKR